MARESTKTVQYADEAGHGSPTKGDRSRKAIVQAARRLIAINGYQSTSLQKVADALGMSQSAVMHHYPTKVALFRGVLDAIVEENAAIAARKVDLKDDAMSRLMKFFETNYEWAIDHDFNAQIMTCLFHFASYDDEFRQMYDGIISGARGKILEALHAGRREKLFKLGKSPELTAEMLHDGLFGSILAAVTTKTRANNRAVMLEKWRTLVRTLTGAI